MRIMTDMAIMMIAVNNNRTEWQFREYRALHIDGFLTREDGTANDTIILLFNKKHASSHENSTSHIETIRIIAQIAQ